MFHCFLCIVCWVFPQLEYRQDEIVQNRELVTPNQGGDFTRKRMLLSIFPKSVGDLKTINHCFCTCLAQPISATPHQPPHPLADKILHQKARDNCRYHPRHLAPSHTHLIIRQHCRNPAEEEDDYECENHHSHFFGNFGGADFLSLCVSQRCCELPLQGGNFHVCIFSISTTESWVILSILASPFRRQLDLHSSIKATKPRSYFFSFLTLLGRRERGKITSVIIKLSNQQTGVLHA